MTNNTTMVVYSTEYLAQSRTGLLTTFYSVPIPLEILSTAFRLWVKVRAKGGRLAFDDYLIVWATVRVYWLVLVGVDVLLSFSFF